MSLRTVVLTMAAVAAATAAGHSHAGDAHGTLSHTCIHESPAMRRAMYGRPVGIIDDTLEVKELVRVSVVDAKGRRTAAGGGGEAEKEVLTVPVIRRNATMARRVLRSQADGAKAPIRVSFRTLDLETEGRYCMTGSETISNYDGGQVKCTAEDVLIEDNRRLLKEVVLPRVANVLQRILTVVPSIPFPLSSSICNGLVTVPEADNIAVTDTDVVIFVSAAPAGDGVMAWARTCVYETNNGRPLVVQVNMGPKNLYAPRTEANIDMMVRVGVHEILHGLGWSSQFVGSTRFQGDASIAWATRRGQQVAIYNGAAVLGMAREHFDCSTLDGVEMEDEGGSGTASSHWERRFHYDDVMAPTSGGKMRFTAITFSLLEDSGHYGVNYDQTESDAYMQNAGCGVFTETCNTTAGGLGTYYCLDSVGSTNTYCEADFLALGKCDVRTYTDNIPEPFRYFTDPTVGGAEVGMGYCPTVAAYSGANEIVCNKWNNTVPNITEAAMYFARDGRCFKTSARLAKGTWNPLYPEGAARCLRSRCPDGNRIEFQVGDSPAWVQCPLDGSVGTVSAPSPYSGEITCPVAKQFCTPDLFFGVLTTSTAAATTKPLTTTTTTTTPVTTTTTTSAATTTTTTPVTTTTTTSAATTTTTTPVTTTTTTNTATTTPAETTSQRPILTTMPPIIKAAMVEMTAEMTTDQFIAAFREHYQVSDADVILFIRWATDAEIAAMGGGARRSFAEMSTRRVGIFGFQGRGAETAVSDFIRDAPNDSELREALGTVGVGSMSVQAAMANSQQGTLDGAPAIPTMIAAVVTMLAALWLVVG